MPPSSEPQELVLDRLIATGASDHTWSDYVLATLRGDAGRRAALDGIAQSRPQPKTKTAGGSNKPVEPPGVFVASIAIAGFRGIGPPTTLPLKPGFTMVARRNNNSRGVVDSFLERLKESCRHFLGRPKWAGSLPLLKQRLSRAVVEVGVWKGNLVVGSATMPLIISVDGGHNG